MRYPSRDEIVLIGPLGAGKSTLAAPLAARLGVPRVEADALSGAYYARLGYDDAYVRGVIERDFRAAMRYRKPFEARLVEHVVAEYSGCVFDFGAGHVQQDDRDLAAHVEQALAPFTNVVLVGRPFRAPDRLAALGTQRGSVRVGTGRARLGRFIPTPTLVTVDANCANGRVEKFASVPSRRRTPETPRPGSRGVFSGRTVVHAETEHARRHRADAARIGFGTMQSRPRRARPADVYSAGYGAEMIDLVAGRGAGAARFLTPHLRPGDRVLDCGCGPGAITVALAEVVAPGLVVGVDRASPQVELARGSAERAGAGAARFVAADAYELPFADGSFDAAFAHTLLIHLSDPLCALREIRRVLAPGGVVNVRDPDWGSHVQHPSTALLRRGWRLQHRVHRHLGGDPFGARRYRELLLAAGFERVEADAAAAPAGTAAATRAQAAFWAAHWRRPELVETAVAEGWADRATLAALADEMVRWGERPEAFFSVQRISALGWTPGSRRTATL